MWRDTVHAQGGHYKTKRGASVACAGRSAAEVAAALGLRGVSRLLEEERSVRAAPPVAAAAAAAPTPSAELSAFLEGTLPGAAAGAVAGYGAALAGAGAATVDDLRFVEDAVMVRGAGCAGDASRAGAQSRTHGRARRMRASASPCTAAASRPPCAGPRRRRPRRRLRRRRPRRRSRRRPTSPRKCERARAARLHAPRTGRVRAHRRHSRTN